MDDLKKLYSAALANRNMTELPGEASKTKFEGICQRIINDSNGGSFEKKLKDAEYYLQMLLLYPNHYDKQNAPARIPGH